ncbi:MAG: ribosome small subunit-dependent GTPase A [Bacteroidetes bacterium]|nr:MAG: ribosome small subunit-dependent GTPase A [Bacteroidota bacterium]
MKGVVIKSTGKWYLIENEDGQVVSGRIRGKLRMEKLKTTNPIAVGDRVILLDESDEEGNYLIQDFEPRKNYIVRKSTNLSKQMQILAANVDLAFLVVTLHSPQTHLAFIDRFLVSAESFRIPTILLFNKTDLYSTEETNEMERLIELYQSIGYECYPICAQEPTSIDFIRQKMTGKQVMVSGHSGVGKSTLINSLDPELNLRIGAISQAHRQGQHTTTFAEMFKLDFGAYIIDTPGIRAFGIVDLDKEVISHYFPEMREILGSCKFHNCQHLNEPQCAVKNAVEMGEIPESRYKSYLQLMLEDESEVHRKKLYP